MEKCEYAEYCDGEGEAIEICQNCGLKYCEMCAENQDGVCDCVEQTIFPRKNETNQVKPTQENN